MIFTNIHMCIYDSTDYNLTVTEDKKYIELRLAPDKNNLHSLCLISIAEDALDDLIQKIITMIEQKSTRVGVMP
jgi:hypothetical protein